MDAAFPGETDIFEQYVNELDGLIDILQDAGYIKKEVSSLKVETYQLREKLEETRAQLQAYRRLLRKHNVDIYVKK